MITKTIHAIRQVPEGYRVILRVEGATADGSEQFEERIVPAEADILETLEADERPRGLVGTVLNPNSERAKLHRLAQLGRDYIALRELAADPAFRAELRTELETVRDKLRTRIEDTINRASSRGAPERGAPS